MLKSIIKVKTQNILKLDKQKIINYLENDKIVIIKKIISKKLCNSITKYLTNISHNTIPNYFPIRIGSPNNFRVNLEDQRAMVKGSFYQFSFFPWNQDVFNFFKLFKNVFIFKNRINMLSDEEFFYPKSDKECAIRLSFQFYPKKTGFLNQHQDPVDYHQKYLMIMNLSKKGKDFQKGGLFSVIDKKKIMIDNFSEVGDLIFFKADIPHGVELIDPKSSSNLLEDKGRWMALFATNKLPKNNRIKNSVEKKG